MNPRILTDLSFSPSALQLPELRPEVPPPVVAKQPQVRDQGRDGDGPMGGPARAAHHQRMSLRNCVVY